MIRALAVLATAGMFLVLVMGAAVTNSGSAEGCGRSWPLCNGQFVPEFTVSTTIEYSHRAVTGIEGVLVVGLTAAMLALWRRDREVVALGLLMLGTLLLQAGLGAAAVLTPQTPFVLATHFGVSLIAFASTFLSAAIVFERTRGISTPRRGVSAAYRRWVIGAGAYVLVVVYLGAYIRHAGLSLACADWPLCNGQVIPSLDASTGPVFAHRVAALGAVCLLAELARRARVAGVGQPAAYVGVALVVVQSVSGALVVWTRLGLFSALAHAAIMALLFATLAHLIRLALISRQRNDSVADLYSLSDGAARTLQPPGVEASRPRVLATTNSDNVHAVGGGPVVDDVGGQRAGAEPTGRGERPDH
jgi:cytochrome c oxidase assembly protein subunit 15